VFTVGVYAQLLETLNSRTRVGEEGTSISRLKLIGWQPRRPSFLVAFALLVGSLLLNVETTVAPGDQLGLLRATYLSGTTALAGALLFVVGTYLQLAEVCHRYACLAVRDISWWSALPSLVGSAGFLLGAAVGLDVPGLASVSEPALVGWAYLIGSALFAAGSYLMLPETFSR